LEHNINMDIIIKVYDNYRSNVEKFSFLTKEAIKIEEDLDSFDIATFKVKWYELIEYNKIEIYEVGIPDKLVFKWLVYQPEKNISILRNETIITCRSERNIMSDRKVLVERDKNDTVANIINELLSDYSTDSWSTSIAFPDTINIKYNEWDSYDSIFSEIAKQCWWFWDIKEWVIIMDYLLWTDKTWGSNKIDVVFTKSQWDNIKNVNIVWQSTRSNIIIWDDWVSKYIAQDMTDWFVYWVTKYRFREGDLAIKTEKMLEQLNIRQRILNIELDPNKTIEAYIWDKLNMEISNVNDLEDIKWEVLVTKRIIDYSFARKRVQLFLWENVIKEDSLWDIIVGIKRELDMIS